MPENRPAPSAGQLGSHPASALLLAAVTGAAALVLGGLLVTAGDPRIGAPNLWALHFLGYLPLGLRAALAVTILAAALLPARWPAEARLITHGPAPAPEWKWMLLPLPLLAVLFWLCREQTLHGDGLAKLALHRTASLQTDPYVWKEPLDSLLAYSLSASLAHFGIGPRSAIAGLSVAAGLLFWPAALYLAQNLTVDRRGRILWMVALCASGSTLLWFGHIENYSLVTAAAMLALALSVGYLRGTNVLWPVGLAAGLAASLHPQAAFLFPGLAAVIDWPNPHRARRQILTLGLTGPVVPILTVLMLVGMGVPLPGQGGEGVPGGELQLFWTPAQALELRRLTDALINLWLVAPMLPILTVGMGVAAIRRPPWARDRLFWLLTGAALPLLGYHFTFQNELPRPQDWDLFAIVGPFVTLWALYGWGHAAREGGKLFAPRLLQVALLFALIFSSAWIGVNAAYVMHLSGALRPTETASDGIPARAGRAQAQTGPSPYAGSAAGAVPRPAVHRPAGPRPAHS